MFVCFCFLLLVMWGEISFTRFPLCLCVSFSDSHGDTAKRHQEESPQHKLKRCVKRSKSPPGIDVNDSLSQSDILAIDAVSADICLYCILSALPCIYEPVILMFLTHQHHRLSVWWNQAPKRLRITKQAQLTLQSLTVNYWL